MAQFENPINTRTGGSVPVGTPSGAGRGSVTPEGLISSVVDFGAEQVTQANRRELSEQVAEEAESFIDQPERMTELQRMSRELEQERGQPRQQQDRRVVNRVKDDMTKLRRAMDQGAASATEVKMRADQMTRDAIASNPSLSRELIQQRNQTLGLFGTEMEATDSMLENVGSAGEQQEELRGQAIESMQNDLIEAGMPVTTGDPIAIEKRWRQHIAEPRFIEHEVSRLESENNLTEQQAQRYAPDVVQATSSRVYGQMQTVLDNPDLSEDEKVQQLEAIRLRERDALSQKLSPLGSEELNRRFNRVDRVIEKNIGALEGTHSAEAARNSRNTLINDASTRVLENSPNALSLAVVNDLGGDSITTRLVEMEMGGIGRTVQDIRDLVAGVPQGREKDISAEEVGILDRDVNALETWYENIANPEEGADVTLDDRKNAFRNVMRAIHPSSDKELTEIPLEKWHSALDAMSKPQFKDAIESLDMSSEEMTSFSNRIQSYQTNVLEPNMAQKLLQNVSVPRTREGAANPTARSPSEPVPLVQLVEPQFNESSGDKRGNVTFMLNEERLNELNEGSGGQLDREHVNEQIRQLNGTYARRWNQSAFVTAQMTGNDPFNVSVRRWNDRFADPEELEDNTGTDDNE